MTIAVALKWVDLSPEIDPLTGLSTFDPRTAGASPADEAALETALRLGSAWAAPVVALSVGPPGADSMLRRALAAGASSAARVEAPTGLDSAAVAQALAGAVTAVGADLLLTGDWSLDRGSGSVPPLVAGHLDWAQACGLVSLAPEAESVTVRAERRLDRGGREHLRIRPPAVLSVEGAVAQLRREPLSRLLEARGAEVECLRLSLPAPEAGPAGRLRPFRPRPHLLAAPDPGLPARGRILVLTGNAGGAAAGPRRPSRRLTLQPAEAAQVILDQLSDWGLG